VHERKIRRNFRQVRTDPADKTSPVAMRFLPRELPPIVIADDNPDDQRLLLARLTKAGVENPVFTFGDGAELMEFLRGVCQPDVRPALRPCLLLLDLNMPRLGGFDVAAAVRDHTGLRNMTVVLLPGALRDEDRQRAAHFGIRHAIPKFPSAEMFAELVQLATEEFAASTRVTPFERN
jgi:CheY-like chemotaxis protein